METSFRTAELVGTNLSSSNLKSAVFRNANLCGADLSSSQLARADFRGFDALGNATNLTRADLRSSGCRGIRTNARTIFCNTIGCDGEVINPGCDGCCVDDDCGQGERCDGGACVPDCLTANTCCGTNATACRANCCTGLIGDGLNICGGLGNFNCARSGPGGSCGTDNDCTAPLGQPACRAGRCCSLQGGFCVSAAGCCNEAATCDFSRCSA